ncbi:diacylglycerol kinase eta isoform X3 [Hyperolius riggenbachi]|uniref:diacylglycerol kinase eta isoform X3 n=1 Tax=Hyperolius riggenbachi TaxID=752182 RepID=UPI0035A31499
MMEHAYPSYSSRSPVWDEVDCDKMSGGGMMRDPPAGSSSAAGEESSDSEGEHEGPQKLIRKVSTSGQIRTKTSIKEGLLLKQTSSFQRWKKRYFKLRGRTLYYAKDSKSLIFDEVDLSDASVAESSTKNVNNSFTIITPFRRLILCAENRKEMEDWISSLKSVQSREHYETAQFNVEHFSGMHNWYACSHARPTFCNVCRESLSGVTSHGLSCEVCKFKAHKRCAVRATNNCKWTTLASIGKDIIEDEDGIAMPHQWLEGNLPVSAKCAVCDKTCGSVLRLQDWRCLWCKAMVHTACKDQYPRKCPLGQCKVSIIPPTALNSIDSDGFWKATCPPSCASPLLVFVNSKSGDNQGVKFLRRFKQLLNPAQVFDLMNGGPHLGLRLFQKFDNFRILVCGGDGSVGWVLSEIDKLSLHKQCQLGVLPLGTGNDLARVLGWGGSCDDDTQLPQILEKLERASTKMLDRWSIMSYELKLPSKTSILPISPEEECEEISAYEDSVATHLAKILNSDKHSVVISSAKVLCETVKDFVAKVGKTYEKPMENSEEAEAMAMKCSTLNEKLDLLLQTLHAEAQAAPLLTHLTPPIVEEEVEDEFSSEDSLPESKEQLSDNIAKSSTPKLFKPREQLMLRANSLKKAVRQIIEQAEKVVDEQNAHTEEQDNQAAEEYRKELEDSKEEEKDEDTKELDSASNRRTSRTMHSHTGSFSSPPLASSKENLPVLNTRIICPGLRAGLAASIAGSSIINKMLLANMDTIGASPFIDPDSDSLEGYSEKCVMNNYFGIGLDAKISLEFNNKREEHPEKCRSRTKNMMWYGVLGTKELLQRTYKNLEQKVQLECDGQYIPLPSLQGIAVLNIPSYAGGTNFWGGTKEDDIFGAPSFDDKILEVVAVFGSMQMAVSRVIKLQHHRIAQCRSVKITILGEEGVPVQVDGEAWIQPPGVIKIVHKNRAQMLTRDRAFENTLKSWEDKQKYDSCKPALRPHLYSPQAVDLATEEEVSLIHLCSHAAEELITRICEAAKIHSLLEQELAHAVNACSHALNKANPRFPENLTRNTAIEVAMNVKALHNETESLLVGRIPLQLEAHHEELLSNALHDVEVELTKLAEIPWLYYVLQPDEEEDPPMEYTKRNSRSTVFRIVPKFKREKAQKHKTSPQPVQKWGTDEVAAWLDLLSLGEYKEIFIRHDIRGSELVHLERRDLKDLGIMKVGHMKRILQGIKELGKNASLSDV